VNPLSSAAATDLRRVVQGPVVVPGEAAYDTARCMWNGRINRRPLVVVRCAAAADVQHVVRYARHAGLELAVRSTGHNAAGAAVCDDGVMIDLSDLNGLRVDVARRRAWTQGGVRWGTFDQEAQTFGLATTGGRVSGTGVAGVTLGGGLGWLMRLHGLTIDNLLGAEVVTAEGEVLQASEEDNPDLFWALRGGGGNFGIVTSLSYLLHPITSPVTGGAAFFPASCAARVIRWFREVAATSSDALAVQCNLLQAPHAPFVPADVRGLGIVAVAICHAGSVAEAEQELSTLEALPAPLLKRIRAMPYVKMQRLFDSAGTYGLAVHGRSGYLPALTDQVIDTLLHRALPVPSSQSIVMISTLGGAVGRVGELATAYGHRTAAFNCAIEAIWDPATPADPHLTWCEELWSALAPLTTGTYVNELGNEGPDRTRAAYHPVSWERLRRLKHRYDPANVFHLNQNIPPLPPEASYPSAAVSSPK
jgi:FAD/FMN-containing dehydrogenase